MTGLLIVGGYVLAVLATWRWVFCQVIDSDMEDDRFMAAVVGWAAGMCWFLVVPAMLGAKLVVRPTPGERRQAREAALTEELAEVKRLAREHGLPL